MVLFLIHRSQKKGRRITEKFTQLQKTNLLTNASRTQLLFCSNKFILDVRWLSAGKATERLFELREEVQEIVNARAEIRRLVKAKDVQEKISGQDFWIYVAYMADVFKVLNKTCATMQTNDIDLFEV